MPLCPWDHPGKNTGEWVAISYCRGSSWPRAQTQDSCISCINWWILYHWTAWEARRSQRKRLLGRTVWPFDRLCDFSYSDGDFPEQLHSVVAAKWVSWPFFPSSPYSPAGVLHSFELNQKSDCKRSIDAIHVDQPIKHRAGWAGFRGDPKGTIRKYQLNRCAAVC